MTIIVATGLLLLLYAYQLLKWRRKWQDSPEINPEEKESSLSLSVIIPFRNEAAHLNRLLESLAKQSYKNCEFILVDDHSEDNGYGIVSSFKDKASNIRILRNRGEGKKLALMQGALQAKHDYIVTTDADCYFHPQWLTTIAGYLKQNRTDLLIGPVRLKTNRSFLGRFQQLEFLSLQISGAAAAIDQKAIMCNGANLICRKEDYMKVNLKKELASGDDMFLLEWMKKEGKRVEFLKSKKAMVSTDAADRWQTFFMQRARWAAKARSYVDRDIVKNGLLVGAINGGLMLCLLPAFINMSLIPIIISLFALKAVTDYLLLKKGTEFYVTKLNYGNLLLWQFFYPIYVLVVLLYPLFTSIEWKQRKI